MNNLMKITSFFMAGLVSLFSPMTINQGDAGCCAACALKKEEEIEVVDEQQNDIGSDD
jgi:hypothetical protein